MSGLEAMTLLFFITDYTVLRGDVTVSAPRRDPFCVASSYHTDHSLKWLGGARKPIGIIVFIGIPLRLAHIYSERSQIEKTPNVSLASSIINSGDVGYFVYHTHPSQELPRGSLPPERTTLIIAALCDRVNGDN